MRGKWIVLCCSLFLLCLLPDTTFSQTKDNITLKAVLNTDQEIPTPRVEGRTPSGTAMCTVQPTSNGGIRLIYDITVNGLSGPITVAHFHNAAAGATGPVVRDIHPTFRGNTATGIWSSNDATQPLTEALFNALMAGDLYLNVHTAANGPGEIRGQLYPTRSFVAKLDIMQEIPAPNVTGQAIPPTGTATVVMQTAANGAAEVAFNVTVDNLTGPIVVAHFHNGATGATGPVVKNITFTGNSASGVWRSTDATQPLTPALLRSLLSGGLYVNVHTAQNQPGEIRGQVLLKQGRGDRR